MNNLSCQTSVFELHILVGIGKLIIRVIIDSKQLSQQNVVQFKRILYNESIKLPCDCISCMASMAYQVVLVVWATVIHPKNNNSS